jgi:trehalose 6-phosphate phosphatase
VNRKPLPLRDHTAELAAALLAADRVLLGTDFDGTLVPLRDDPTECVLDEPTRALLAAIHRPPHVHVAVVSGRLVEDVRGRIGLEAITCAGNHGLEIIGEGIRFREPTAGACEELMQTLAEDLRESLANVDGANLEHKQLTLTVHVRKVDADARPAVRAIVARAARHAVTSGHVRLHGGKDVIELRPNVDWHKGRAVEWLADQLQCRRESRVFIGDDETDEDAFITCHDGITIRVGDPDRPTAARFVATTEDVRRFLTHLARPLKAVV